MATTQPARRITIGEIALTTPDGDSVVLGGRIEVPTIVILARYYG